MKIALTIFLFVISSIIFGQSSFNYQVDFKKVLTQTKDPNDSLAYNKLLKRFKANDKNLTDYEVLALMIGFTDKPDYKPYSDLEKEREIYNLNDIGKYKKALKMANKFLQKHPVNQQAIIEKSFSFYKLEKKDSADFYLYQFNRIMKAMDFSGNGIEIPIFALGPADGQNYIRKYLSAGIGTMGTGRDKNGNFLDILGAKFEDGTSKSLNFIIQHATDKMFE